MVPRALRSPRALFCLKTLLRFPRALFFQLRLRTVKSNPKRLEARHRTSRLFFCATVSFGSATSFFSLADCRRGVSTSGLSRFTFLLGCTGFAVVFGVAFLGTLSSSTACLSSSSSRRARFRAIFASRSISLGEAELVCALQSCVLGTYYCDNLGILIERT